MAQVDAPEGVDWDEVEMRSIFTRSGPRAAQQALDVMCLVEITRKHLDVMAQEKRSRFERLRPLAFERMDDENVRKS